MVGEGVEDLRATDKVGTGGTDTLGGLEDGAEGTSSDVEDSLGSSNSAGRVRGVA